MNDLKQLNTEQEAATTHGNGPLLIIAGAGTGKTTVVTERIKHLLIDKKVDPKNILALTFTEKASKEMQERIDIALPYGYTQMWISTFHSFCDRVLRDDVIHIGLNSGYKLATEAEMILFLRKHLFKLNLEYFRPLGNPNKFLQGLLQHFNRLKDEDINPEQYLHWVNGQVSITNDRVKEEEMKKYLELANTYKKLEELKIQEGIMDFGDLISYTLQLFRTRKHILKEYQEKFKYILIDEFQDTNYAQNQLALLLAGEKQNITVVGDDDQAIYRWRGAAISNMIQFTKHFPKAKIITLTKNYRSTENILNSSYQLIQYNNPDRLEVKEKIDKKLVAQRKIHGEEVELLLADRGDNEADFVIAKIKDLMSSEKKYEYKDFAILVRANDHAQIFSRALERQRIPFQFLGPGQLFHQEEIKDLIAYLKVLYDFSDSSSLYRVLAMPIWQLSATEIAILLHEAKAQNKTLFEVIQDPAALKLSDTSKETAIKIVTLIKSNLEKVSKETAGQILYSFLQDSGLLQTFIDVNTPEQEIVVQNVAKFFDRLKAYESEQPEASVFAVVEWIDLSMQLGESPLAASVDWSENNAVNILTIHSSKGLEFPVVFVTNLVTQRFPTRERREQIPIPDALIKEVLPEGDFHLQEERRLFYVAMTRAKDFLFLTAANIYGDGKRERKLSPFLQEAVGERKLEDAKGNIISTKKEELLLDMFAKTNFDKMNTAQSSIFNSKLSINYISYSQIQTFDICPLHYKLKYILNIPSPQTPAQVFGTILHATLKDFYMRAVDGDNPQIKDIEKYLKDHWISEGYDGKDHEEAAFQKGLTILKNYLEANYSPIILPIALEVPFNIPISKTLHIGGRIDRIDRVDEETLEIIDYKTGSNIPSEKDLLKNFQLTLYGLAASEIRDPLLHRKPEHLKLSLYYLEDNIRLTTTRTIEQLQQAKEDIITKAKEISESDFKCVSTSVCANCEYKILCKTSN